MAADNSSDQAGGGVRPAVAPLTLTPWTDPVAQPLLRFEAVSKRFGGVTAVDQLSLDIFEGEFFALLGPSGCGKTTLLRMLAGFERPDAGRILLDGHDIAAVPPHRRPVNMMFQNYALFPHMTVEGNVAFGLKQEGVPKAEIAARVGDMLALVKLEGFGARRPHQLSGGQRQRVALARALVKRPRLLLLDEPLAALDRKLREDTRFELMELRQRLGLTFIVVTHDQDEAMTVASRIGVMNAGRLAQVATPAEIYERPNSRWIADFIGDVNLLQGRVVSSGLGQSMIELSAGGRVVAAQQTEATEGTIVWVALRPERLTIEPHGLGGENSLPGRVEDIAYRGGVSLYRVKLDNGLELKVTAANRSSKAAPPAGRDTRVFIEFPPEAGVVLLR